MLYVVTCFMKLQRADSTGILADSCTSTVLSFQGGTGKLDACHTE